MEVAFPAFPSLPNHSLRSRFRPPTMYSDPSVCPPEAASIQAFAAMAYITQAMAYQPPLVPFAEPLAMLPPLPPPLDTPAPMVPMPMYMSEAYAHMLMGPAMPLYDPHQVCPAL